MSCQKGGLLSKLTGSGDQVEKYACRYARLLIINLLILFVALFILRIQTNTVVNIRYLLSAIAQALATVFALTVTIPILLVQLFPSNSLRKQWLKLELRPLQLLFYGVFVFSIVFPLLLLATNNSYPLYIKLSLGLTAVCLYSTIESALAFKQKLQMLIL